MHFTLFYFCDSDLFGLVTNFELRDIGHLNNCRLIIGLNHVVSQNPDHAGVSATRENTKRRVVWQLIEAYWDATLDSLVAL